MVAKVTLTLLLVLIFAKHRAAVGVNLEQLLLKPLLGLQMALALEVEVKAEVVITMQGLFLARGVMALVVREAIKQGQPRHLLVKLCLPIKMVPLVNTEVAEVA